jgi:ABC-type transport system involved in multi-copper enzyme maturation permease subunit
MTIAQRFAQVVGAAYLLVGIVGFIPPLILGSLPAGVVGPFAGLLLGLFAVNWFHSLAHLLIGAAGLAVHRNRWASLSYALALGIAFAGLFVLGLIFGLHFLGGLMPLNGTDDVLHILTALIAFGVYFASRDQATRTYSRISSRTS